MTPIAAAVASTLLSGAAVALAGFDHPRLGVASLALAVLLLTHALSASLGRPRS